MKMENRFQIVLLAAHIHLPRGASLEIFLDFCLIKVSLPSHSKGLMCAVPIPLSQMAQTAVCGLVVTPYLIQSGAKHKVILFFISFLCIPHIKS